MLRNIKRKLCLWIVIALAWFCVVPAQAQIQGYDALGLAMYCDRYLRAPHLGGLSTLLSTFGDPLPCIEEKIKGKGLDHVQVDLIDATCWRNNNCAPGVPKPDDLRVIKARAQKVSALAMKYPSIDWWVSSALEHDVRDERKVKAMMEAAKAGCPTCRIINSPYSGAKPSGYPIERHGTKVSGFAVSGDGASIFDADNIRSDENKFEHRVAGSYVTFAWFNELNLRCTGEKTSTPPKQRTEKPTPELFRQAYLVMQPEQATPNVPDQCRVLRDIERGKEINKPNAESYCNGQPKDKRGNRPLLIIKKRGKRGDRLNVFSPSGRKVGCFQYYGPSSDVKDGHRWYMGDCSGQKPTELYDQLGGEWGYLELKRGECLRFNAIRRQGIYR